MFPSYKRVVCTKLSNIFRSRTSHFLLVESFAKVGVYVLESASSTRERVEKECDVIHVRASLSLSLLIRFI